MSELYKAMKRIEDYQSTKPLYKQIAEIKGIASTARYGYDIQPQLTIPKSIADIIDGYCKHNFTADRLIMMAYRDYQEFNDWIIKDWVKNDNIARAYLAGKALGVDLVKVGDDDRQTNIAGQ
ncbi:hypothetical protein [Lactococcus lactis]|uniref:hypothetical protein n=1 Tax=Lactococcus lactis TaxID=1358 RepID=UPI00217572A0|nr:hypothetical protein [Lactococcus lactis]